MFLNRSFSVARALAALALLSALSACGGNSNPAGPGAAPRPTPAPTPVTTTVVENSFTGLEPDFVLSQTFTTTLSGDLQAVVDWTFASNDLDVLLVRGGGNPCLNPNDRIDFDICTVLVAASSTTTKPERLGMSGLSAGTYTLYIWNHGPSTESLSYQILLTFTPSASAPGAGVLSVPRLSEPLAHPARPERE